MDVQRNDTRGRRGGRGLARTLGLGAAAIALFAAAGVAVIWALGEDPAPPAAARPEPAAAADPVRPAAIGAPPQAPPLPAQRPPAASTAAVGAPRPAPEDLDPSWGDIPVLTRDGLGPVGGYVFAGLRRAQEEMKHCLAGAAGARGEVVPAPVADESPAVLMLYLVSREGAIDVVEARTEEIGSASPDVVECCRAVLQGQELKAPNAQPGRRYRLRYAL